MPRLPRLPTSIRPSAAPALRSRDDFTAFLREETTGGLLLLAATLVALVWANLAPGVYHDLWDAGAGFGPHWLHLDGLTVSTWVADGLLAFFFYVAGLELKRELVVGELADRRAAALPVAAALGGMVAPALVYLAVARGAPGSGDGWAIPVATDIAFALGVLSLVGGRCPASLRVMLLSLAVVDDLGAIVLIAVLFTSGLALAWLFAAVVLLVGFACAQRSRWRSPILYVPLAAAVWVCIHASGVHATMAGIALGLLTRVRSDPGEHKSPALRLEHRLHPLSAGVVVPVFALSAAGVSVAPAALADVLTGPITQAIIAGLLVGKLVGVLGGAWLAVRLGAARLPDDLTWSGFIPLGLLAGIGYTVSLLIAGLALPGDELAERASTAVLLASAVASVLALLALRRTNRRAPRADRADPDAGPDVGPEAVPGGA